MAEILLTKNMVTIVDDEDFEYLSQFNWQFNSRGYATRTSRTIADNTNGNNKTYLMHRIIMNPDKLLCIDHINGNKLDNRKSNLRFCTRAQNARNRVKTRNCSSEYKGVTWNKRAGKWKSQIHYSGKKYALGCFTDELEAYKAYKVKAMELFGEFFSERRYYS